MKRHLGIFLLISMLWAGSVSANPGSPVTGPQAIGIGDTIQEIEQILSMIGKGTIGIECRASDGTPQDVFTVDGDTDDVEALAREILDHLKSLANPGSCQIQQISD